MARGRFPKKLDTQIKVFTLAEIEKGINKLERRIQEVKGLDPTKIHYDDQQVKNIESNISNTIREVFGENSAEFSEFGYDEIWHGGHDATDIEDGQGKFAAGIPQTITMLGGLIARLEEKRDDVSVGAEIRPASASKTDSQSAKKIFVSHSSDEKELAKYFADWLDSQFPGVKCFCSSRPKDLTAGDPWFTDIIANATESGVCLTLFSPETVENVWLHFEAGLVLGASDIHSAVPVLYGGLGGGHTPPTIKHYQALFLQDDKSFDAFVSKHFLDGRSPDNSQTHAHFIGQMPETVRRILQFGSVAKQTKGTIKTSHNPAVRLNNEFDHVAIHRNTEDGKLASIRIAFVPRRQSVTQQWKFGIALLKTDSHDSQIFQFHAGCHANLTTWSIYFDDDIHRVPINVPARLETEKSCKLQLWISPGESSVACVGIDSDGQHVMLRNDKGGYWWRLVHPNWDVARISAWADGDPFQVDVASLEIDRCL